MTTGEKVAGQLARVAGGVLLLAILIWPLDWLVWKARVATGGGMGTVVVSRFTVAELKGSKEDYYFEGTGPADCSESLFQHAGDGACWRLRKKPEILVRY